MIYYIHVLYYIACCVLWLTGYEPYDTPYYGRNLAIAIIFCFFTLFALIFIVNIIGYLIGAGSRSRNVQVRTVQI